MSNIPVLFKVKTDYEFEIGSREWQCSFKADLVWSLILTKKHEGAVLPKNTAVEVPKIFAAIPSSNLFVVEVPVLKVLGNVLLIYSHQICL